MRYWLSFADATLPAGTQFLGACIVDDNGLGFENAIQMAWMQGINPGGSVRGQDIPDSMIIIPGWENRLLSRQECEEFDRLQFGEQD